MFSRNLLKLSPLRLFTRRCCCESQIKITTLENGIRVATEETNAPLSCISLFIEAGPRFETACYNGITHFIEHLAFKGLTSLDRSGFEEVALYSGIRFAAKTTQEYQRFQATCPVESTPQAIELLSKIISELNVTDREVQCERYNLDLELYDLDRDPKALAFENLIQTAFQGTSLGQRVIGPTRNLERFDASFVTTYIKSHYQPWRLTFATSGYVRHEDVVSYISTQIGGMAGTLCTPDYGAKRYTGSEMTYRDDSMPYAHVCLAFEAPGFISPDYYAMIVLKHMVGSWNKTKAIPGSWPELAMRCTDTELCESFESFYLPFRDVGLFGLYFVCRRLEVEDMVHNVQNVWMNLCATSVFTDMDRARQLTRLELAQNRLGSINSSLDIGRNVMYTGAHPTLAAVDDALNRVKMIKIHDLAFATLYDRCPAVAAVGPTESLPEYNRIRASTYWLRL